MVTHQVRGNYSLGLDSFLASVTQLVRLTLLKGTRCSNSADSFCTEIGLGFVKTIIPLQFSSSLLKLTIPSKWHHRSSLQPLTYTTSQPGKSNLRGIYYSCPLSVESRCERSIHNPRGTFHLEDFPCSHSIIYNPSALDLVTETTQTHLGCFNLVTETTPTHLGCFSHTEAENVCTCVHI